MYDRRPPTGYAYGGSCGSADTLSPLSVVAMARSDCRIDMVDGGCALPPHLHGAVVALGNFDGLHHGHQAVVRHAVEMARMRGVAAIISTFEPHPARYFKPDAAAFRLSTIDQRRRWCAAAGADAMMVFGFGGTLAGVAPQEFVDQWLRGLGGVVTGANFSFGRGRAGDVRLLAALGSRRGLACAAVNPVTFGGTAVSSSRIRAALRGGDCALATALLSRPYTIESVARTEDAGHGQSNSRVTIDLGDYMRPALGAYDVRVSTADTRSGQTVAQLLIADDVSPAILNLRRAETARTIMGRTVAIEVLSRIR